MHSDADRDELRTLNEQSRAIWDSNAGFWDDYMGDAGNDFHQELVAPSAERLLDLHPGETVLEVACGAGLFARRLAQLGANVVATDFSAVFLQRAKERTKEVADRVELRLIDATDERQLLALGERSFDAAVSNMALMDMPTIEPLLSALSRLLKPGGRFVFTLSHPCFNRSGCVRMVEENDLGDMTYAIKVTKYLDVTPTRGTGIRGQPEAHYYFDRPLSTLFNACFQAGFVLDGIEEPIFARPSEKPRSLALRNFQEIPMVLAARMRLTRLGS